MYIYVFSEGDVIFLRRFFRPREEDVAHYGVASHLEYVCSSPLTDGENKNKQHEEDT